jgi:GntR family transcriptional regulator
MRSILQVDPALAVPIWKQIEEGVRRLAASGTLAAGAPVPSVRELARDLAVNPATVAKAYQRLADGGLLEVRRGEGTFVRGDALALGRERETLLREGAAGYRDLASSLGFDETGSRVALERAWRERDGKGGAR